MWAMSHSLCLHIVILSFDWALELPEQLPDQLNHNLWGDGVEPTWQSPQVITVCTQG